MSWWPIFAGICLQIAALAVLIFTLIAIRKLLGIANIPHVIQQPERCASCSGVLSDPDEPVEFTKVPVDTITGGTMYVQFRVCQRCVTAASEWIA